MTAWGFCLTEQADVQIASDRRCPNDGELAIAPSWGTHRQVFRDGDWHPIRKRPEGYVYRPPAHLTSERPARPRQGNQRAARQFSGMAQARFGREPVPRAIEPRPCKRCHEVFAPKQYGQHYCQKACRLAATQERRERSRPSRTRPCCQCGQPFEATQPTQLICSYRCRRDRENAQDRARAAARRTEQPDGSGYAARDCAACGQRFTPTGPAQRYCTSRCRRADYRLRVQYRTPMSQSGRACTRCQRDDRPHGGKGLCHSCYVSAANKRKREGAAA